MADKKKVGKIVHYYDKIKVGIIELKSPLKVDQTIEIKGNTTDLEQRVDSMQLNHKDVKSAKSGESVGIQVSDRVRDGDEVYLKED